jgi:AcrR family transcriptional regulator
MDKRKSVKRRGRRNKYKMRLDLLDAVRDVLKEKGFVNLNINNVAQMADVDRNAIYRHFGSFDNLLSQYFESKNYLLDALKKVKDNQIDDFKSFLKQILFDQYKTINKNVELQQLIVWEMSELSLRTKTIARERESITEKLLHQLEDHFRESNIDINFISAIMIAGIYYLVIHKRHSTFCLVDFVKESDRVLQGLEQLVDIIFEAKAKENTQKNIAVRALQKGLDIQLIADITGLSLEDIQNL